MAPRLRKQGHADYKDKSQGGKAINSSKSSSNANEDVVEASNSKIEPQPPKHGMLWRKVLGRLFLSALMIFAVYWTSNKKNEAVFASQKDKIQHRSHEVPCSKDYNKEVLKFKGCAPNRCGRLVTDIIVTGEEAAHLFQICKKGLAFGGSDGGASILDLHSGALSHGSSFVNIYKKIKAQSKNKIFTEQDFAVYRNVRHKIQQMIAFNFGLEVNKLYLTHPTFFSQMTSRVARTAHDEYWHVHVDKETYPSFHYTSLLYLSNYGDDFVGGRFVFVDKPINMTIEPRFGRVSAFTSGAENPHFVEKVTGGIRYALTVSFTCDKKYAIGDPSMAKFQ